MSDTLIDTLQNKEYVDLKNNLEKVVNKKIMDRVAAKKAEVIAKVNGVEYVPPVEDEPETIETDDNTPPEDTPDTNQENDDSQSTVTDDTGAGE